MKQYWNKKYISIGVIIMSSLVIYLIFVFDKPKETVGVIKKNIEIKEEKTEDTRKVFRLDVKGAIKNPGVYEGKEGDRIIDILTQAGGVTENADTSVINLSKNIEDEMVIIIYTKDEIMAWNQEEHETTITEKVSEWECPKCLDPSINDACITESNTGSILEDVSSNFTDTTSNEESVTSLLSINTASLEQLDSLPGIGISKAQAIIDYRTDNGLFLTIEDILNVSGIGDSIFVQIKNLITV